MASDAPFSKDRRNIPGEVDLGCSRRCERESDPKDGSQAGLLHSFSAL
jgi:hypothetical protein